MLVMVIYMFYYLNMFLIGSIIGFLWENGLSIIFPSIESGILFGPWVTIYGLGVCIIIFIERLVFNRFKVNRFFKVLFMVLFIMLIVTGLEFLGGVMIKKFLHKTLWDYSKFKFNIGKYICLEITLLWGIMSLLFVYIIKPLLEKFIYKIPRWVSILVFGLLIIDFVITCLEV